MVVNCLLATLVVLLAETYHYMGPDLAPICPQEPKYPFPAFIAFSYRKRYWKQVCHNGSSLYIVGQQLRLYGGGCYINITVYSRYNTGTGLVKNNHGLHKGV